jgi:hypothetical protein
MNIFVLDRDPVIAAKLHTDKHVVKMILETAQLLSTAHHVLDGQKHISQYIYKKTHTNHPCAVWVRQSSANYKWTVGLFAALLDEFEYRYNKVHSSARLLPYLRLWPRNISVGSLTPFAQAMPDEFKNSDGVIAYQQYYNGAKRHLFGWKNRQVPSFIVG